MRDISLTEALEACRRVHILTPPERVGVPEAAGRVLALDVVARVDMPSADCAAMDGYAVRAADTPGELRVIGEHRAGHPAALTLAPGTAIRISTGAVLPEGADAIARLEVAQDRDDSVVVEQVPLGKDVRRRGEVIGHGQTLLEAGTVIAPTSVGALGAVGHATVSVIRRPRVAVIGMGDELAPLGTEIAPGQVYDSNRVGVAAQIVAAGGEVIANIAIGDDRDLTVDAIHRALGGGVEVVVTIGGVSAGPHDHVRPAMRALGFDEAFHRVRTPACRPTWLGVRGQCVALALPGNPVSAAVAFHLFGRLLLGRPHAWGPPLPILTDWRPKEGSTDVVRCRTEDGGLRPLPNQASHAVTSLARADGLAVVDGPVRAGDRVPWLPLPA